MDWHALLDAQELAQLLPAEYARYAEPVCEGLAVFLGGLPEQRQQELAARQVALRPGVTLAERLGELAHQCPVLHKLGQSLARDPRLAPALRAQLRPLECLPSTVTVAQLQQAAERALGPLKALDLELEGPALAEASVAVVVPFRRRSAPDVRGVLKLLKHGVEPRLECELELLARVGAHLDEQCDRLGLPAIDYRERFEEISEKLVAEIQFEHEQRHLELAQRLYANDAHVQIPRLYRQWCTPRATAMERLEGKKVTDHALVGAEAARLGSQVTRALVSRPLLAAGEEAIFHCDPHAGNLMLAPDGRLAVLDWSLVSRLTEEERAAMTQLLLAMLVLDQRRIVELVERLGPPGGVDRAALANVAAGALQRYRSGEFPGFHLLVALLDGAVAEAGLRASVEMTLFRKAIHTLEGVVGELSSQPFDVDQSLAPDFALQLASELPTRWLSSLDSRDFATRISNRDLMQLAWAWPLAAARYWCGGATVQR